MFVANFEVSRVVRYEDLSLSPYNMTQELFDFYGLSFGKEVREFLDKHTKEDSGLDSSTFRDSKLTPFRWIKNVSFEDVQVIQKICEKAMKVWGYKIIENSSELLSNFNPLLNFPEL